ncbi:MAG: SNF2-related protein, partial [Angustibacter sp.]
MALQNLSEYETSVRDFAGAETFAAGQAIHRLGGVRAAWDADAQVASGTVGARRVTITQRDFDEPPAAECDCYPEGPCQHVVAMLLAVGQQGAELRGLIPAHAPTAAWEESLAALAPRQKSDPGSAATASMGVQFTLSLEPRPRIGIRPVTRGRSGAWVVGGPSWADLRYPDYYLSRLNQGHFRLLREVQTLWSVDHPHGTVPQTLRREEFSSRRLWDVLVEAQAAGVGLVQAGPDGAPVLIHSQVAELTVRISRDSAGLRLDPALTAGDVQVLLTHCLPMGVPAHGVAWWGEDPLEPLHLGPMNLSAELTGLLDGSVQIPREGESIFWHKYYPALRGRAHLLAGDGVEFPAIGAPVLELTVRRRKPGQMALSWQWIYLIAEHRAARPLWAVGDEPGRDPVVESRILDQVQSILANQPQYFDATTDLMPRITLEGADTIEFVAELLPALQELRELDVVIDLTSGGLTFQELDADPVIEFRGDEVESSTDWFDLEIVVTMADESVPFADLFVALARAQSHLMLPSGSYFRLDRPEFEQLAALIAEARAMGDAPPGTLRVSRFQAGVWQELERLGVVSGQAAHWQSTVRALSEVTDVPTFDPPQGLTATLRPYQLAGYNWLAALYDFGLGGIIADDMGLGKTVQTLALMCHIRESGVAADPFLVIAPTSVVPNWASEAAKFAPNLKVVAIKQSQIRRGTDLATAIAGADLIITSYTLFRIEFAEYAAESWAGLFLDEAQFIKNHQSKSYQCVKKLSTP